jgi:hypothetical protein
VLAADEDERRQVEKAEEGANVRFSVSAVRLAN